MLYKFLPNSLPVRAWTAVITVTLLFFLSALSSGMLAWVSESDAEAINTAGSIRMATYRANYLLQIGLKQDVVTAVVSNNQNGIHPDNFNPDSSDPNSYEAPINTQTTNTQTTNTQTTNTQTMGSSAEQIIEDMEKRLAQLSLYQNPYVNQYGELDKTINQLLIALNTQWQQQLKPALLQQDKEKFYAPSIDYINNADSLVSQLQYRNEQRQQWQQIIQVTSLLLSILVMMAGLWELHYKVLLPVRKLTEANRRFKTGKLDTRVTLSGYREFDSLAASFNETAETIEHSQAQLEQEVTLKTAHLTQANQVLSLLYDFAYHLTNNRLSLTELNRLITNFEKIIPKLDFTLCLQTSALDSKDSIALHGSRIHELCSSQTCDNCMLKANTLTKSYALKDQDSLFGELRVKPKHHYIFTGHSKGNLNTVDNEKPTDNERPTPSIHALITQNEEAIIALSNLISTALSLEYHRQQEGQLMLLKERETMARELHDSLAQSLSYLKIQVSILQKRIDSATMDEADAGNIKGTMDNIKEGLNSAYQHLRDLLTTFRLSIDENGFDMALNKSAEEFSTKGGFEVDIDNQVMTLNLNANEQVNLMQIIRESLSNISRHAKATNVTITMHYDQNHVILTIKDNGIGISHNFDQTQHHGLMIMKERAHSLGGKCWIKPNQPTGTQIIVRFIPDFFKTNSP